MHKKNTLQQNTDTQPKRRTWKSVAAGALMLANILANPQQTAVSAHTIDRDNKNPNQSELPTNDLTSSDTHTSTTTIQYTSEQTQTSQDTIDYTNMAHFPIKWIIKHYGPERSIEIFQQTLLIEVNKVRKEN